MTPVLTDADVQKMLSHLLDRTLRYCDTFAATDDPVTGHMVRWVHVFFTSVSARVIGSCHSVGTPGTCTTGSRITHFSPIWLYVVRTRFLMNSPTRTHPSLI